MQEPLYLVRNAGTYYLFGGPQGPSYVPGRLGYIGYRTVCTSSLQMSHEFDRACDPRSCRKCPVEILL
eukprot:scaffold17957_cov57-Attheya_sp.AAC.2